MTTLTAAQTLDMLGDLAAGAIGDVFSQDELQRFYDRAEDNYNLAVYYGWLQILGNSASWVSYRVAQTQVSRGDAFDHIKYMVELWGSEARTAGDQVRVLGMNSVPPHLKQRPADETAGRRGYLTRNRWFPY